jgi:hypothetical protein
LSDERAVDDGPSPELPITAVSDWQKSGRSLIPLAHLRDMHYPI